MILQLIISVLENMHISEAFKLMHTNPNYNVFEGFDKEKYKKIRNLILKHTSIRNWL